MAGRARTPLERANAARKRMPHVPEIVVQRLHGAYLTGADVERGACGALDDFFARLEDAGLSMEEPTAEIFARFATSRSRLRALLASLGQYAPEVPLAAATEAKRTWDAWLNDRYNTKEKKTPASRTVGLPVSEWPSKWQDVVANLSRPIRIRSERFPKVASKTRNGMISATGLLLRAREWSAHRGVDLPDAPCPDLIDAYVRFLLLERKVSPRTAADYLERVRMFLQRAEAIDDPTREEVREAIGALLEMAAEQAPSKWACLRSFRAVHDLPSMLKRAADLSDRARDLPGHSAARMRISHKAVAIALLVNTADRQGDVRRLRIGQELIRHLDGTWEICLRQGKTGIRKELGALWPITGKILDAYILSDRPAWTINDQVAELDGVNLLKLEKNEFCDGYVSELLKEEFGISAHLIRTLVCDEIRVLRPDAMWAAQVMLGHRDEHMHTTYRSDFSEVGAIMRLAACFEEIEASVGASRGCRRPPTRHRA